MLQAKWHNSKKSAFQQMTLLAKDGRGRYQDNSSESSPDVEMNRSNLNCCKSPFEKLYRLPHSNKLSWQSAETHPFQSEICMR